ncbi:MAG: hypothetical protein GEV03_02115 [Streptosporangiales bacterium]|nr:hypothetical protein [Streptosporangiales bacterium]
MADPLFTGVGVALVTLFDSAGEVDAKASALHAKRLVDDGMRAVLVAGSTGEAGSLSAKERIALLEAVRSEVPSDVPVLAGTGASSARQAAAQTSDACEHGADGVLALSPPGSRRLGDYYAAVLDAAGDVPVLAYHFPRSSAPGIDVETLAKLPVRGVKDSAADPERLLKELAELEIPIYNGSAVMAFAAGALGCRGSILAVANAEPELAIRAFAGDAEAQRALIGPHLAARADFPEGLKRLVADKYGTSPVCRL